MVIKDETNNSLSWRRLHLSRAKLKASSRTSALLSGFAMVAMVEVSLNCDSPNPVPAPLLISFVLCTTLLVSVHMLALMISTCILPNIESDCELGDQTSTPPIQSRTLIDSPHDALSNYIEIAWLFSTVLGVFLFLIEIAFLCWVKFWDIGVSQGGTGKKAATAATLLLIPVFIIFIGFAIHFYRKLVSYKYERSAKNLEELVTMVSNLQRDPV